MFVLPPVQENTKTVQSISFKKNCSIYHRMFEILQVWYNGETNMLIQFYAIVKQFVIVPYTLNHF
jgi:hypothetical protein